MRPSSGGLRAILGRLGGSWEVFGGSQAPLGASGGHLGGSWGCLGWSWNHLGEPLVARGRFRCNRSQQVPADGAKRDPKWDPRWDQKRPKIEDKFRHKKDHSLRSAWGRLRPILGRFGSPLGFVFIGFSFVFVRFREHSCFSKTIVLKAVLGPTWVDVGAPNGAKKQ